MKFDLPINDERLNEKNIIGQRVRKLRKKLGMSQTFLSEACEVNRWAIARWENGKTVPNGPNLVACARVLGVSPEWLATGKINIVADQAPHLDGPLMSHIIQLALEYQGENDDVRHAIADAAVFIYNRETDGKLLKNTDDQEYFDDLNESARKVIRFAIRDKY